MLDIRALKNEKPSVGIKMCFVGMGCLLNQLSLDCVFLLPIKQLMSFLPMLSIGRHPALLGGNA